MASWVPCMFLFVLCVTLTLYVFADENDCGPYQDLLGEDRPALSCYGRQFCCGSCSNRYCCSLGFYRITKERQERCALGEIYPKRGNRVWSIVGSLISTFCVALCCLCPCWSLYRLLRRPQSSVNEQTYGSVSYIDPQQYSRQPGCFQTYPGGLQPYGSLPIQPGYSSQPMAIMPHPGQHYNLRPPPPYEESSHPTYPYQQAPYNQAAIGTEQPAQPLQTPVRTQVSSAQMPQVDFPSQPSFNPDHVTSPKN